MIVQKDDVVEGAGTKGGEDGTTSDAFVQSRT
jgi:hypothetical protein